MGNWKRGDPQLFGDFDVCFFLSKPKKGLKRPDKIQVSNKMRINLARSREISEIARRFQEIQEKKGKRGEVAVNF